MAETLRLHADDPTRLLLRGRAVFLLGSTEHYGAVLNDEFDYERYLDAIAGHRLSLTRVFGFYREIEETFRIENGYVNTLAPRPERYLAPWARAERGAVGPDGLPKFDLDCWDERYFARLRAFVEAAGRRGVVVEMTLFCNPYNETLWRLFPLHPASNVNGVGTGAQTFRDFMTLRDPSLVENQRRYVRKVVAELNGFDNLIYEVCNEPVYFEDGNRARARPDLLRDWQRELIRVIREAEAALPNRHLVAVNPHLDVPWYRDSTLLDDRYYGYDPDVDLLNVHYVSQREPRPGLAQVYVGGGRFSASYRFGNIATFTALRAAIGKPIGFDEDYPGIVDELAPNFSQSRMEAWESLVAGCALYDHLDLTFTPSDPTGSAAGETAGLPREWFDGRALRRQFAHVAAYAAELDLATLRPSLSLVHETPQGMGVVAGDGSTRQWEGLSARLGTPDVGAVAARCSTAEGVPAIIVYLGDLRQFGYAFGSNPPCYGRLAVGGAAPGARYAVRTLNPQTGEWADLPAVEADGSCTLCVEVPPFREDLLVHLEQKGSVSA